MKVLIIDDDKKHGEALSELLTSRGHEAYFAPSDREAEWLCELFRFDLSVIDFDMPSTTGTEVARRLLRRSPETEVVIVSAHASGSIPREALGDLPFFPKPIDAVPFLAFIEGLLLRRRGAPLVLRAPYPLEKRTREE